MKALLLTPWDNAWIPYFRDELEKRGWQFILAKGWNGVVRPDLVIHGWASGATQPVTGAKNVMFLRRYELFDGGLGKVNWKGVDHLICVNTWIADRVREIFAENGVKTPVSVIYNGTDLNRWKYAERQPGKRIGMACHVHPKKNLPLALQIIGALPKGYELHIAGDIQDVCTAEYIAHVANSLDRDVFLYGHVPHEQLNAFWDRMDYCLSTSLSEGNPNNVIEAMAKGIKPVVHNWPGAEDQFPIHLRFDTVHQAVAAIESDEYESAAYRNLAAEKFGLQNYARVVTLCESLFAKEAI